MKWQLLMGRRLSVEVEAVFDGNPCVVVASFSLRRGLTIHIELSDEEGESILHVSPAAIRDAREQLGV